LRPAFGAACGSICRRWRRDCWPSGWGFWRPGPCTRTGWPIPRTASAAAPGSCASWRSCATVLALALGGGLALLALGPGPGLVAILVAALVTLAVAALARAQIGGHTGDVLGAAQQSLEVAVLLTAAALL